MVSKKPKEPKRWVDLSESAIKKHLRCKAYLDKVAKVYTPESCLQMMKKVCEVRNKALQKHDKELAKYCIGDTYYKRDVTADIAIFMQYIRRQFNGKFPKDQDFSKLKVYVTSQKKRFKNLKPLRKRSSTDSDLPGKTSFNQPGIYNGLA